MNYASIVPLIGGETIAMENVFGTKPKYILTYEGFQPNEEHLLNWYNNCEGIGLVYHNIDPYA